MDADSLAAENLFTRITSFTTEEGSDRIENLCTEVLAWCLIHSEEFRQRFLKLADVVITAPQIHTQRSLKPTVADHAGAATSHGLCDLVVFPESTQGAALFVEVKVWSRFRPNQLADYFLAAKRLYSTLEPKIVTITPFSDCPEGSQRHITWSQVGSALENERAEAKDGRVQSEFARFLKSRGVSKEIAVDKLDSEVLSRLRAAAAKFEQFNRLFALFRLNEKLNAIFRREAEKPKVDFDHAERAWFGIYTSRFPWYYAGMGLMPEGVAVMWVEVGVRGDRLEAAKNLPDSLKEAFARAVNLGRRISGENPHFAFAQPIDSTFNGQPQKMFGWFATTILAAKAFVEKIS